MSRPLRIAPSDAVVHVIARGNAGGPIVLDDRDRASFLELLATTVERYVLLCHAYCLLDTHYHLLLETPRSNLSLGMRQLNGRYAARFNRRHGRFGHLFQGRFRSILVEKETHLLEVARYIALNPVRAGICAYPDEYAWSSYRATAGLAPRPSFLSCEGIRAAFGVNRAQERYREYVALGLGESPRVVGERVGGESFLRLRLGSTERGEVPRAQVQPLVPPLADVFAASSTPVATAYRDHGYTLAQIAAHLGCHCSTVSRRLRREEALVLKCKT